MMNQVIFPIIPQTCDLERMKKGGEHWQWDPTIPMYLGVLPRYGAKGSDVKVYISIPEPIMTFCLKQRLTTLPKWFRAPHGFPGHVSNAYEDSSGQIIIDFPVSSQNVFFWWPDKDGHSPDPRTITNQLRRFTIDYKSETLDLPPGKILFDADVEFPRIDDRLAMRRYNIAFTCLMDHTLGTDWPYISQVMGGGFPPYNSLAKFNIEQGTQETWFPGPRHLVQECIFIPRKNSTEEGDGYVMALVNNYHEMISELIVLDTKDFGNTLARIRLPLRLRAGFHGNWVDAEDVDGHPAPAAN